MGTINIKRFEISYDVDKLYECYLSNDYSEFFRRTPPDLTYSEVTQLDTPSCRFYSIYNDSTLIGFITLNNIDNYGQSAGYGLLIFKEYQETKIDNNKISFIASILFHKFIFSKTFINKLSARVLANRDDLVKNLERSGYEHEGYFKQAVLYDGKMCDEIEMAVFKDKFLEVSNGWIL